MADESSTRPAEPAVAGELRDLTRRAQAGDATALPRIKEILDAHPEVWSYAGDLANYVEQAWITVLSYDNPVVAESMRRSVAAMRAELGGDRPSRLVRLLVEQVVANWLETTHVQSSTAHLANMRHNEEFQLKRLESAQKRYQAAIRTLTEVRALEEARPAAPLRVFDPKRRQSA